MPRHTHIFRLRWIMPMSPADYEGWTRVVMHGVCPCGASWILAGEERPATHESRMLEDNQ